MSAAWATKPLRELAQVRVSNVDKKTHPGEKPVKLCNYMDVYSNEYITPRLEFMDGSATSAEIERFALNSGDVVITKDSETPDDIGIAAVIMEQIGQLVCGYHLALIRPKASELDSIYLAKQLSSSPVARYFAIHASGSTRYGLPVSAIESLGIPIPPKPEQARIAEVLSTMDRAIEHTEVLITKQQRIKTGLIHDLFTRGSDEHGHLRSEKKHKFKDSPLGRIPIEWEVKRIGEVFEIQLGKMLSQKAITGKAPFAYLGNKNVQWDYVDASDLEVMDFDERERSKYALRMGDILVCEGGEVGRTCLWRSEVEDCYFQKAIHRLRPLGNQYLPSLFPRYMRWAVRRGILTDFISQTSIAHLTQEKLAAVPIIVPRPDDQARMANVLDATDRRHNNLFAELKKLESLKAGLMQDLLSGKKRVTALLEPERKREKVYASQ
jgi:type I restriction enzyme S subunit